MTVYFPIAFTILTGLDVIDYVRDFSFAYLTPLEYLYPQLAYCEAAGYQIWDTM